MTRVKYIVLPIFAAAIVVWAGAALAARWRRPGLLPEQPIAFNHKLHLERVQGVACADCHQFVTEQPYAGLPSKHVCFGCHDPEADAGDDDADANKPAFASLMAFAVHEGDIPWRRVTAMNEDVFFSHRRHVTVAELDCRACHADMPDRTRPPERGPIRMSMDDCVTCHESSDASVDCVSCHR